MSEEKKREESTVAKPGELVAVLSEESHQQREVAAQSLICPRCQSGETSGRSSGGRRWRLCLKCGNIFNAAGTVVKTGAKRSKVSKDFKDKSKIHSLEEIE